MVVCYPHRIALTMAYCCQCRYRHPITSSISRQYNRRSPVPLLLSAARVCGVRRACAMRTHAAYCWGRQTLHRIMKTAHVATWRTFLTPLRSSYLVFVFTDEFDWSRAFGYYKNCRGNLSAKVKSIFPRPLFPKFRHEIIRLLQKKLHIMKA